MKKIYLEPKFVAVHISNTDIVTTSFTQSTTEGVEEMSSGSFGAPGYREFDY